MQFLSKKLSSFLIILFVFALYSGSVLAETDTQEIEVPAQPVYVEPSTTTKRSPVGDPVTDYKPKPSTLETNPPPPPARNLNPQNDPDVQRGIDNYQKP